MTEPAVASLTFLLLQTVEIGGITLAFDLAVEQLSLTHATASELKTLVAAAPNEFARGWLAGIQLMHSQLELVQDAAGARLQLVQEHRVTNKCSNSRS